MSLEMLTDLLDEVKPLLLKAGVLDIDVMAPIDYRVDHDAIYPVVCKVISEQYKTYEKTRALVPETMWEYYEATDTRNMPEQRELIRDAKALRHAWRTLVLPFTYRKRFVKAKKVS